MPLRVRPHGHIIPRLHPEPCPLVHSTAISGDGGEAVLLSDVLKRLRKRGQLTDAAGSVPLASCDRRQPPPDRSSAPMLIGTLTLAALAAASVGALAAIVMATWDQWLREWSDIWVS